MAAVIPIAAACRITLEGCCLVDRHSCSPGCAVVRPQNEDLPRRACQRFAAPPAAAAKALTRPRTSTGHARWLDLLVMDEMRGGVVCAGCHFGVIDRVGTVMPCPVAHISILLLHLLLRSRCCVQLAASGSLDQWSATLQRSDPPRHGPQGSTSTLDPVDLIRVRRRARQSAGAQPPPQQVSVAAAILLPAHLAWRCLEHLLGLGWRAHQNGCRLRPRLTTRPVVLIAASEGRIMPRAVPPASTHCRRPPSWL